MFDNSRIGGLIGAGVGILFVPFLGLNAIPMMATAGVAIGKGRPVIADLTKEALHVLDKRSEEVLTIINKRSKEVFEGVAKTVNRTLGTITDSFHHSLMEGCNIVKTGVNFTFCITSTTGAFGVGYLADLRRTSPLCTNDPEDLSCQASLALSVLTTAVACLSFSLIVGKACFNLLKEPQSIPLPNQHPMQPPLNNRFPETAELLLKLREENNKMIEN